MEGAQSIDEVEQGGAQDRFLVVHGNHDRDRRGGIRVGQGGALSYAGTGGSSQGAQHGVGRIEHDAERAEAGR